MRTRILGRTGREVSEIGFGAWQIGADWGDVDEDEAMATLHAAADAGVTFFDTADVYGDGRSERLVGRLLRERAGERSGRHEDGPPRCDQTVENYSPEHFREWNDRSRENLGIDTLTWCSCTARRPTSTTTRRSSRTSTRWSRRGGSRPTASASSASRRR